MTASIFKTKENKASSSRQNRYVEVTLSPAEAGFIRLLSAVLQEPEEEVVTDLLTGRLRPAAVASARLGN
jgi:hypothetical protein